MMNQLASPEYGNAKMIENLLKLTSLPQDHQLQHRRGETVWQQIKNGCHSICRDFDCQCERSPPTDQLHLRIVNARTQMLRLPLKHIIKQSYHGIWQRLKE